MSEHIVDLESRLKVYSVKSNILLRVSLIPRTDGIRRGGGGQYYRRVYCWLKNFLKEFKASDSGDEPHDGTW